MAALGAVLKFPDVIKALNVKPEKLPSLIDAGIGDVLDRRGAKPSDGGTFSLSAILRALPSCQPEYEHNPLTVSNEVYTKAFLEKRGAPGAAGGGGVNPVEGDAVHGMGDE